MKSSRALVAFVLALVLAGLACSSPFSGDQNDNGVGSSTSSEGDPSSEDSSSEDGSSGIELPVDEDAEQFEIAPLDQLGLWNPADLFSYRADFVITFDGINDGEGVQGSMSFLMEVTTDPPARHFLMDLEGNDLGDIDSMNTDIYFVDGTSYIHLGPEGGWMSFPGNSIDEIGDVLLSPEDIIDLPSEARRSVLPETVNGVLSWHYSIDETNFESDDVTYESMLADVWVAVDGGYLVKMDATSSGSFLDAGETGSFLDEGTLQLIFNLLDVNQAFLIELPPLALQATDFGVDDLFGTGEWTREDIPLPEDALISFAGPSIVEAGTALSVEDARDFMIAQLEANGWMLDGEPYGDSESYFASYIKGDELLSLAINVYDQTTSILVIVSLA